MVELPLNIRVYSALQKSLIGSISCEVRGISLDFNEEKIIVNCIFDGVISEADLKEMEVVDAEFSTSFLEHEVEFNCIRVNYPQRFDHLMLSGWFFKRKE
jgi:hypothetical protein